MGARDVGLLLFVHEPETIVAPVELGLDVVDPLGLELVVVLVPVEDGLDLCEVLGILLRLPLGVTVLYVLWHRQCDTKSVDLVDRPDGTVL